MFGLAYQQRPRVDIRGDLIEPKLLVLYKERTRMDVSLIITWTCFLRVFEKSSDNSSTDDKDS